MIQTTSTILRKACAIPHARLARLPIMARLLTHDYSLKEYTDLLFRFGAAYTALEESLTSAPQSQLVGYKPRIPLIQQALVALGYSHDGFSNMADHSPPFSAAECWGRLYVLEGSILGGGIISRHLHAIFDGIPYAAYHPFQPYDNPEQHWLVFRQTMDSEVASPEAQELAIRSAVKTFMIMHDHLVS